MKLTPIQNAFAVTAAVCLLTGKYAEHFFPIANLILGMVIGMLLVLVLINHEYYIEFGKRVIHFLYQRWQWKQHLKMMRYQQYQRRP